MPIEFLLEEIHVMSRINLFFLVVIPVGCVLSMLFCAVQIFFTFRTVRLVKMSKYL